MKLIAQGEYDIPEFRQTLFEQLNIMQNRFSVRHMMAATLYFTPTNGFGNEVSCKDHMGREIETMYCNSPYRSVAEQFEIFQWHNEERLK